MNSHDFLRKRLEKYEKTRKFKERYICHQKGCRIKITPPNKLCVSCLMEERRKQKVKEYKVNKANREAVYMKLRLDGFM